MKILEAAQKLQGMLKVSSTACSAGEHCRGHLTNKTLVSLGQFNEALLNSDNFDYIKDKYPEEENLLPDQIHTYLQHVSIFLKYSQFILAFGKK